MKRFLLLTVLVAAVASLAGCETTGNPNEGGIFWSESKAQGRLNERQHRLNQIESDTASVEHHNRQLERRLDEGQ
jgi:hypothetical protein